MNYNNYVIKKGFTMIELMITISVILVLLGIFIASLPGIKTRISRNNTKLLLKSIEVALASYKSDNGEVPENVGTDKLNDISLRNSIGLLGSSILYQHLSGDWNLDGKIDSIENGDKKNEKVYIPNLDLESSKKSKSPRSMFVDGKFYIVDSFGDPIRYISDKSELKDESKRSTNNFDYDLWSLSGADANDPSLAEKYIKNWE